MAWPPALPSVGFKAEGFSTFIWGTSGFANQSPIVSSYIIKSVRPTERTEQLIIENGDGLTSTQILLLDGINYEITVVDDSSVIPPISGTVGSIIVPSLGMNGTIQNTTFQCFVVGTSMNLARKTEGERVFEIKTYVLFAPS
jgi:hypothetical protein